MMMASTPTPGAPLVSVIVAVYNGEATLEQCLDSIVRQTYANVELIVVDGGSQDGTLDIVRNKRAHIADWLSEPDRGVYDAWNKGLKRIHGDWVCFLGADDFFWSENVLERMAASLVLLPAEVRIAYGQVMLLSQSGKPLYPIGEPWPAIKERFKQVMCIPHPGLMHRRSVFEEKGCFDDSFKIGGDYELMLRELLDADASFIPDLVTVGMRQGGISSVPENAIDAMKEARRAQAMHGLNRPGAFWLAALARVYFRMLLWRLVGERNARRFIDFGRRLKGLPPYWTETS